MWHLFLQISEQANTYSTVFGKLWYLCVFLYRMIVIATIGAAVYGDEQSAFRCSSTVVGCQSACFNQFSKVSHIRYWAFQVLVVATPTVLFHFYSTKVAGDVAKLKKAEEEFQADDDDGNFVEHDESLKRYWRKKKNIGKVEMKEVYTGNGSLKGIPYTLKIQIAYVINVFSRLALEGLSLYVSHVMFTFPKSPSPAGGAGVPYIEFMVFRVPVMYHCFKDEYTNEACYHHFTSNFPKLGHQGGTVPCWVSRPWEKTIFMTYMQYMSAACCIFNILELFYLVLWKPVRNLFSDRKRESKREWDSGASRHSSIKSERVFLCDVTKDIPGWSPRSDKNNAARRSHQKMSRV